jgi:hypothetical protein
MAKTAQRKVKPQKPEPEPPKRSRVRAVLVGQFLDLRGDLVGGALLAA